MSKSQRRQEGAIIREDLYVPWSHVDCAEMTLKEAGMSSWDHPLAHRGAAKGCTHGCMCGRF